MTILGRSAGPGTCRAYLKGDVEMASAEYGAHGLTLDCDSDMQLQFYGVITGADPACSVTKLGTGMVCLGMFWADGLRDTWAGPTDLKAGTVITYAARGLPDATDVTVEQSSNLWLAANFGGPTAYDYPNTFSGAGQLVMAGGELTLSGSSPAFTGDLTVWSDTTVTGSIAARASAQWATLRGTGTVHQVVISTDGKLSPGVADYAAGLLTATGTVSFADKSSYFVDIVDADGDAGTGFDAVAATGDVLCPPAEATDHLRASSDGSAQHDAEGFDSSKTYRWPIVTSSTGSVLGFDASRFVVDATAFSNALDGGAFSVARSADGTALELVFTPKRSRSSSPHRPPQAACSWAPGEAGAPGTTRSTTRTASQWHPAATST